MEYAILVLLVILSGFLALIYKKLDTRKDDQEEFRKDLGVEREVKSSIESLNSKISSDLGKLNERLGVIDAAQRELTDL